MVLQQNRDNDAPPARRWQVKPMQIPEAYREGHAQARRLDATLADT